MIPDRYAAYYLENAPSLLWLIGANLVAVLVGVRFYVEDMAGIHTFLWPLYLDSPAAVLLMALSLSTLLPFIGQSMSEATTNRVLTYLHTIAFVWLVKFGLWTVAALNIGFGHYYPDLYGYFAIIITHLLFVLQAYLIPYYGRTTRGALLMALCLALLNDIIDYGFGYHPPLRYEPGMLLPLVSVALSFFAVWLAARAFGRYEPTQASLG